MSDLSDALRDLVDAAHDRAFDALEAGEELIPFAILERRGDREARPYRAQTPEESLAIGRRELTSAAPDRAVLTWRGVVNTPEGRFDAIFVEAQDKGGHPFVFALRYAVRKSLLGRRHLRIFDEAPAWIEDGEGLIAG